MKRKQLITAVNISHHATRASYSRPTIPYRPNKTNKFCYSIQNITSLKKLYGPTIQLTPITQIFLELSNKNTMLLNNGTVITTVPSIMYTTKMFLANKQVTL